MELIEVQNDEGFPLDAALLSKAANAVLTAHPRQALSALTIVITTDEAIMALNQQYRGIDAPTDVLSFPAEMPNDAEGDMEEDAPYLGDILIAYPYTQAQAQREGHPIDASLALLVIHGTLHLLGYDHDTPENRRQMWAEQDNALNQLGISSQIVPALEADEGEDTHEA